jgi:hypothetical protein
MAQPKRRNRRQWHSTMRKTKAARYAPAAVDAGIVSVLTPSHFIGALLRLPET